jgi:hypothetical protein
MPCSAKAEIERSIAETRKYKYHGDIAALQKFSHIIKDELDAFIAEEKATALITEMQP